MGIFQAPAILPGQVGVLGAIKYMVDTNNLATITAAGYLNNLDLAVNPIAASDVLGITYSYNQQTNSGTFAFFTVSISNGVITLAQLTGDSAAMLNNIQNNLTASGSIVANKVNGTEASNLVTASGMSGVITTSALTTAGGSSYAITWTNTFITATSTVLLSIQGGTNTTENITLTVVPGTGSATLTIYNNTAATALNGTIKIGYLVF